MQSRDSASNNTDEEPQKPPVDIYTGKDYVASMSREVISSKTETSPLVKGEFWFAIEDESDENDELDEDMDEDEDSSKIYRNNVVVNNESGYFNHIRNSDRSRATGSSDDNDDKDETDLRRSMNSYQCSTNGSARRCKGWSLLRRHLHRGTLLLQEKNNKQRRSPLSVRQAMADEFHEGMHFSIQSCLSAIALYLAVSVAMYTFVLEPQWTIIDSCYFAVTTFTTLGYGDLAVRHLVVGN